MAVGIKPKDDFAPAVARNRKAHYHDFIAFVFGGQHASVQETVKVSSGSLRSTDDRTLALLLKQLR